MVTKLKWLRFFKIIIFLVFIISDAFASSSDTVWVIKNKSTKEISIVCDGTAKGLGSIKIGMNIQRISPNSEKVYEWTGHHNDGLGLNHSNWKCISGKSKIHFKTDWGEKISIVVNGDAILVKRN